MDLGINSGDAGTLEVLGRSAYLGGIIVGNDGRGTLKIANAGRLSMTDMCFGASWRLEWLDGLGNRRRSGVGVGELSRTCRRQQRRGYVNDHQRRHSIRRPGFHGLGPNGSPRVRVDGPSSGGPRRRLSMWAPSAAGTLSITGGGLVSNYNANIGVNSGSSGAATVDGPGSLWTNNSELAVGSSGEGTLSITGGGVVTSTNGRIGRKPARPARS